MAVSATVHVAPSGASGISAASGISDAQAAQFLMVIAKSDGFRGAPAGPGDLVPSRRQWHPRTTAHRIEVEDYARPGQRSQAEVRAACRRQRDLGLGQDRFDKNADVLLDLRHPHDGIGLAGLDDHVCSKATRLRTAALAIDRAIQAGMQSGLTISNGFSIPNRLVTNQPTHKNVVFFASSGMDSLILSAARSL